MKIEEFSFKMQEDLHVQTWTDGQRRQKLYVYPERG